MDLSLSARLEKNKTSTDSVWLELLEIQAPTPIYIVNNNENTVWNGITWLKFPFQLGEVVDNGKETPSVPLKVSNVTRTLGQAVENLKGAAGTQVILRVVNSKLLTEPSVIEETFEITKTNIDAFWVTFTLGVPNELNKRFPEKTVLKDFCTYEVYKGPECGATSELPTCNRTLAECRLRNNSARFGGEPGV
jgi:phage-related protein